MPPPHPSPVFETFLLPLLNEAAQDWLARFGLNDTHTPSIFQAVDGSVQISFNHRLRSYPILGLLRLWRLRMAALDTWRDELHFYREAVAVTPSDPASLVTLSSRRLLDRLKPLMKAAVSYWLYITLILQPVIERVEGRFINHYNRSIRHAGDPDPQVFLRGQETRSLDAERSVYTLSESPRELPAVAELLLDPYGTMLTWESFSAACQAAGEGRQFLQMLQAHLEQFGHQISSFDPHLPTCSDDPLPVLKAVRDYLQGVESPYDRQTRQLQERTSAVTAIEARLSPRQLATFHALLSAAQYAERERQDATFELGLAWVPLRRSLLELGRRLASAGAIASPNDVFGLTRTELFTAAAKLDAISSQHSAVNGQQKNKVES